MTVFSRDPTIRNDAVIAWNNLVPDASLAASTSATGFPVSGLLNGVTTDPWKPTAMPATVTVTLAAVSAVSCLSIAAHDLGSKAATVKLEYHNGTAWVEVATVEPENDRPLMVLFPAIDADEWRVTFSGASIPSVAVLHLSNAMTVPGRVQPPHVPLHQTSTIELVGDTESGTGEFLQADWERFGGREGINFSVQRQDFAKGAEMQGFREYYNAGKPFFVACFPEYDPDDMGYCWRAPGADSLLVAHSDPVFMGVGIVVSVYNG